MAARKLTDKQRLFVREYLKDLNATQAYIRAGYSARTANDSVRKVLVNPRVAEAIREANEKRLEKVGIDADYVLRRAVQYLDTSVADFLVIPENGGEAYFDLSKASKEQLACIDGLQLDSAVEKGADGPVTVRKIKLTLPKRKEMLELIGKHRNVQAFAADREVGKGPQRLEIVINGVASTQQVGITVEHEAVSTVDRGIIEHTAR